jgi:hypothetical protein
MKHLGNYFTKILIDGEKIQYKAKMHPVYLAYHMLFMLPFIFLCTSLYDVFSRYASTEKTLECIVVVVIFLMMTALPYWTAEIILTNKRLIVKYNTFGAFVYRIQIVSLDKIGNIDLEQNPIGSLLNYGSLLLHCVDGSYQVKFLVPFTNFNGFLQSFGDTKLIVLPKLILDPIALKTKITEAIST